MTLTCAGLLPGLGALTWAFGPGILINCAAAATLAAGLDWLACHVRGEPTHAPDMAAITTGLLLGLALPPLVPLACILFGAICAIGLAKHAFGGLGANVFNPAMVGYCAMLVSFPLAMSTWPDPGATLALDQLLAAKLSLGSTAVDGLSGATPLDTFRQAEGETFVELTRSGLDTGTWSTINTAFLAGGLFIVAMGATQAILPATFLLTLAMLALVFDAGGSSASMGPPTLHLMAGATMVTAFFIATDPVTSPASRSGQVVFGAGCGALVFLIRGHGGYPDGAAFAVLLMNAATPLIDRVIVMLRQRNGDGDADE